MEEVIKAKFPELNEPALLKEIAEFAIYKEVPAGKEIISYGQPIHMVPLVLTGSIKVMRMDEEGRELLLYYLYPGQTCALSLTCCIASNPSSVKAVAEDETEILFVPADKIDQWTQDYRSWKAFMMETYHDRFNELLETIDNLAFRHMDARLLHYLKEKSFALNQDTLNMTHQEIANELGTSREVISRLLKQLERLRKVKLGRNSIQIINLEDEE